MRNNAAKMFSRNGNDLTAQCSTITAAAGELQATSAVLDGEIVVQDSGVVDQRRHSLRAAGTLTADRRAPDWRRVSRRVR